MGKINVLSNEISFYKENLGISEQKPNFNYGEYAVINGEGQKWRKLLF